MLPRLLVWDNECTYSQTQEALEEAYICEEESRGSLIRMGKNRWQKRLRRNSQRGRGEVEGHIVTESKEECDQQKRSIYGEQVL